MVEATAIELRRGAARAAAIVLSGVVIPDEPSVITPAIRDAMLAGRYEAREARRIADVVEPGDRVMEIGAGIGFVSTLLSRRPGVASVLAVEANPCLMTYMARLHRRNRVRNVRRLHAALGDAPDAATATFYLRPDFRMGSMAPGPNPYVGTAQVPTRDLTALLREAAISLIVCDVEGAETDLFRRADLAGVDRVLVETHDHLTGLAGVAALFASLSAQGFAYDPRHSEGPVVLFRRLSSVETLRPYPA